MKAAARRKPVAARPSLAPRYLLGAALLVGLVARIVIVCTDEGIYWPDEIFQSFAPAHRLAFGYAILPWEYVQGARTWALPGVIALVLKLCALLGGDSPFVYIRVVKLLFALASLGTAWGVYRLARLYGAKELAAALAASLYVLATLSLYFSHRAMSENAATVLVTCALALLLDGDAPWWKRAIGASLCGIATLFRIQSAVFCLGVLVILAARRRWKELGQTAIGFAVWACLYGLLDALTWNKVPGVAWGGWFRSAGKYIEFNLLQGRAAAWGVQPWYYYLQTLWAAMPYLSCAILLGVGLAVRRAAGLVLLALSFVVLHSFIPHKELRFILPVLPLLAAAIGIGLGTLASRRASRALVFALLVAMVVPLFTLGSLTFGDLGAYPGRPSASAWDDQGATNRLLLRASRQQDLCGILVDAPMAWTGGTAYLHRRSPLYSADKAGNPSHFNYAILRAQQSVPGIAQDHGLVLAKMREGACSPDASYSWILP